MDKKAMYKLSYGLFVLTASADGKDNGCIINTAGQAASEPNRLSLSVNKGNFTHDMLLKDGRFNVSIISEEADFGLFTHFGFQSGRDTDKFEGFADAARAANGVMYVTRGTNAYISGKVVQTVDLGSHTLFIADITDMEVLSDTPSTTYAYYLENIKPNKKKEESADVIWRCRICGWEYNETKGDPEHGIAPGTKFEDVPEDFICPLCKHPKSDFERV